MRRAVLAVAVGVLGLVLAGCGGQTEEAGGASAVSVTLADFSISADPQGVPAGSVTFSVSNKGPSEHELVVLRTDLAPDALPVEEGKVEEEASGIEEVGEVEEFEAGGTESATFDLEPGSYVLICNIPGHYEAGMYLAFEVT